MPDLTYVGIDTGGTNIRGYIVDPKTGEIDLENPLLTLKTTRIKDNASLTSVLQEGLKPLGSPKNIVVCAASAGDIDEDRKLIKFSSNFPTIREPITYPRDLQKLGYTTTITNDMRAALVGAVMFGAGKNCRYVLVSTFSSGNNYAVWENSKISMMPREFGHCLFNEGGFFCGCGGQGHIEPYISGNGATGMAIQALIMQGIPPHTILEENVRKNDGKDEQRFQKLKTNQAYRKKALFGITARDVYSAYRRNPKENPQRDIRDTQVKSIAVALGQMISNNAGLEKLICMGSQTKDWDLLFEPAIELLEAKPEKYHLPSLTTPDIIKNEIKKIGVRGAVAYHLLQNPI